jgi:hypothetical protein
VTIRVRTERGQPVSDWQYRVEEQSPQCTEKPAVWIGHSPTDSVLVRLPACRHSARQLQVSVTKTSDPLAGLNTLDLLRIGRHLLSQEPLATPGQVLAADLNGNRSLSMFDILQGLHMVLGTRDSLIVPAWRMLDASRPLGSAETVLLEELTPLATCTVGPNGVANFVAVKMGDVDFSATTPVGRPTTRPPAVLKPPKKSWSLAAGEVVTVPVVYAGDDPLEAWQLGLRFDPQRLQLVGPSLGDLSTNPEYFGLKKAAEGEIRALWLPATPEDEPVVRGAVLFNLTFRVLTDLPAGTVLCELDDTVLPNTAWQADGTEYGFEWVPPNFFEVKPIQDGRTITVDATLEQTTGVVRCEVKSRLVFKARLGVFGAFGERIYLSNVDVVVGQQTLTAPGLSDRPPGVYVWKLWNPKFKLEGHLVKD